MGLLDWTGFCFGEQALAFMFSILEELDWTGTL